MDFDHPPMWLMLLIGFVILLFLLACCVCSAFLGGIQLDDFNKF
jgi:hypothetical protein